MASAPARISTFVEEVMMHHLLKVAFRRLIESKAAWYVGFSLCFLWMALASQTGQASCTASTAGKIEMIVKECKTLSPKPGSNSFASLPTWVKEMEPGAQRKLLNGHTGILVTGTVNESKAVTKGMSTIKNALKGQRVNVFIHHTNRLSCSRVSKYISGDLSETCCDGGGSPPCLWSTGYFLKKVKTGKTSLYSSKNTKTKFDMRAVKKMYREKKYKELAKKYALDADHYKTDVELNYFVGMSYYKTENCPKAKRFFSNIFTTYGRDKANLAFRKAIVETTFNLAKCHAKVGEDGSAILILNSMKKDARFFGSTYKKARLDPDFGRARVNPDWKKLFP